MVLSIRKVTLFGAGLIGSGWLTSLIACGTVSVTVYDLNEEALERCRKRTLDALKMLISHGILTEHEVEQRMACVSFTTNLRSALREADMIQENCPESPELKQTVLKEIEENCRPDSIICTSTSGILIGQIIKNAIHPERVIGAHPYHPVYLMPLVELIRSEKTDERYLRAAFDFYKSIGKEPIILKKECPGYIGSHLMSALFRECVNLISQGVGTMEDIETAFCYGPGLRYALIGPCTVLQLAGGERGLAGTLFGEIGCSGKNWMESFANWTAYPPETEPFFQSCQDEMNEFMKRRDSIHGKNNAEIEQFRDEGLIKLLQHHGKL